MKNRAMKNLEQLRTEINNLDEQLVALIEKRVLLTRDIQQFKKSAGLPVEDLKRETEIVNKLCEQHPLVPKDTIHKIYQILFELSKQN